MTEVDPVEDLVFFDRAGDKGYILALKEAKSGWVY